MLILKPHSTANSDHVAMKACTTKVRFFTFLLMMIGAFVAWVIFLAEFSSSSLDVKLEEMILQQQKVDWVGKERERQKQKEKAKLEEMILQQQKESWEERERESKQKEKNLRKRLVEAESKIESLEQQQQQQDPPNDQTRDIIGGSGSGTSSSQSLSQPKQYVVPMLKLPPVRNICRLHGYGMHCTKSTRDESDRNVPAKPLFAEYVTTTDDEQGEKKKQEEEKYVKKSNDDNPAMTAATKFQNNDIATTGGGGMMSQHHHHPIVVSTDWFEPDPKHCGANPANKHLRCANLGDEIGGILLSYLSGGVPIEKRKPGGFDVLVVGSVVNWWVSNYKNSVRQLGAAWNTTIWGAGTKWGVDGVCFDFRAVRGPKTRDAFVQYGCNVPEVYGDPALLMPYLYDPRSYIQKDHTVDLCLIPHFGDYSSPERFEWWDTNTVAKNGDQKAIDLSSRFMHIDHELVVNNNGNGTAATTKKVRLIDIRTPDASAFVDALSTCNVVASASLHGIILAEAYNITWSWVQFNKKTEAPFKYHDFYLSVGINPNDIKPQLVTSQTTVEDMITNAKIPLKRGPSLYDPIKLLDACPFCDDNVVALVKDRILVTK